jgi:hypothetical protein
LELDTDCHTVVVQEVLQKTFRTVAEEQTMVQEEQIADQHHSNLAVDYDRDLLEECI